MAWVDADDLSVWAEVRRLVERRVRALIVVGTLVLVVAWVYPYRIGEMGLGETLASWAAFMVRTCGFQIGLGLLVVAVVLGLLRWWKSVLLLVPALVLTLGPSAVSLVGRGEEVSGQTLRVMSFNVMGTNRAHDAVREEVLRQDPDIVVIQESNNLWHRALLLRLGRAYPYVTRLSWNEWSGMSLFSRVPVRDVRRVLTGHGRDGLRFAVSIGGEPVVVYAIHPPHPVSPGNVRRAFALFGDLVRAIEDEGGAVMVVGDCNWGMLSPQHGQMVRLGMREAYARAGSGRGTTWCARGWKRFIPGFRIDHVYVSEGLACARAWVGEASGSDHRPMIAEVGWRGDGR